MSSSFWLSSCREVLSFRARPVRVVVSYTECLLPTAFWNSCQAASLHRPLHQLLPAALHAQQQVLDQHHILFLAEVLQVCSCLVQFNDVFPVGVHLGHKHLHGTQRREGLVQQYLMLINLKHDGVHDEGGGGNHVQCLLCLGEPVDEVLQRVMEIRGQRQGFL
ncbi:hypothetical protein F7725_024138 [Dissostichus mawsoni]|uniref:Uncharacterized protein n=1 Tax=Dissostichus mawsoni TaxID=36200 RepID=A0A7J5Y0I4_DISMA|nr:hypothetical protein F7725_024138 [Dissostichus mawsoni]